MSASSGLDNRGAWLNLAADGANEATIDPVVTALQAARLDLGV